MNEEVEKNIGLGFEFLRHLMNNPDMVEEIPNGAEIEFIGPNLTVSETESLRNPNHNSPKFQVSTKRVFEAAESQKDTENPS